MRRRCSCRRSWRFTTHISSCSPTAASSTAADARSIRDALDAISVEAIKCTPYDGTCEDLFFYIERILVRACGEDVAGRLHTARSRNDIDMTMYRMRQREFVARADRVGAGAAHVSPRSGLTASDDAVCRAYAHAAGAADDRRALPARRHRTTRARRPASAGGIREHESQSTRIVRDHRHRLSDRSLSDQRSAGF